MDEPLLGGCVCGAVRFQLTGAPLAYYVCHCTDCQTRSGSAFGLSMIVQTKHLTLLSGSPAEYDYTLAAGLQDSGAYCAQCATRLWAAPASFPQVRGLRGGVLDDATRYTPWGDVWTRSARSWVGRTGGPQYETQPANPMDLIDAWQDPERASS